MGGSSVNRVGYTSVKSKMHNLMLNSVKYTDFLANYKNLIKKRKVSDKMIYIIEHFPPVKKIIVCAVFSKTKRRRGSMYNLCLYA